jgi:hypothetical protein
LLYFENNNDSPAVQTPTIISAPEDSYEDIEDIEVEENRPESLSLQNNEKDLIIKRWISIKDVGTELLMNWEFHREPYTEK